MLKLLLPLVLLPFSLRAQTLGYNDWLLKQEKVSWEKIRENISPAGTFKGTVIASPSKVDPDYYFHWVRDAALTMNLFVQKVMKENNPRLHPDFSLVEAYIKHTDHIQQVYSLTGLGEPKYLVNGFSFTGPWGRPQNDGPALRSFYLSRLALDLINKGEKEWVRQNLYQAVLPANSVLKRDLEYVAHHWFEASFDLWEEVKGEHFYTLMAERESMLAGAQVAAAFGDTGAQDYYTKEAGKIAARIEFFTEGPFILTTLNRVEGLDYKNSNLDIAPILAVLHGLDRSYIKASDILIANTIQRLETSFHRLYLVNQKNMPGTLFGRYPEDQYYGGNPWLLSTLAVAEMYYKRAVTLRRESEFKQGEELMKRVQIHASSAGDMSEQWHKQSGYMLGAVDLTWSHASFLTALEARREAIRFLKK